MACIEVVGLWSKNCVLGKGNFLANCILSSSFLFMQLVFQVFDAANLVHFLLYHDLEVVSIHKMSKILLGQNI